MADTCKLRFHIPRLECFDESSDGMGDDEIQLNVAVLLLDASNADRPVYLPGHHTFLFTQNNFSAGDVVPTSTHANHTFDIEWRENLLVEVLLVFTERDDDEGFTSQAAAWDRLFADFAEGAAQGVIGSPDAQPYSPMNGIIGRHRENETLGVDIFQFSFDDERISLRERSVGAIDWLRNASGTRDPSDVETFAGRVKSVDVDDPLNHVEVRSYISSRNDSNYDVHFQFSVLNS